MRTLPLRANDVQSPHLLLPSLWGWDLNIHIWGEHTYLVYSRHFNRESGKMRNVSSSRRQSLSGANVTSFSTCLFRSTPTWNTRSVTMKPFPCFEAEELVPVKVEVAEEFCSRKHVRSTFPYACKKISFMWKAKAAGCCPKLSPTQLLPWGRILQKEVDVSRATQSPAHCHQHH